MSLLDVIANDGFAETLGEIDLESRQPLYIRRGYIKKSHAAKRITCYKCHANHTRSEHASHGIGSFKRTHPGYYGR